MHYLLKMMSMLAWLTIPSVAFSQKDICANIQNYQQIIQCAQLQSPQIQNSEADLRLQKTSRNAAGQWRNPHLSVEKFSDTDLALQFPIELGSKRAARLELAESNQRAAEVQLAVTQRDVGRNLRLKLERFRQVNEELALAEESLQTFTKLVKQYESRPTLSAEQKVSLNVYKLAKGDYVFRKIEQKEELRELEAYFQVTLGLSVESLKKIKIPKVAKWPVFKETSPDLSRSQSLATLQSELERAQAGVSTASAEAWPEFSVGPSFKILGNRSAGESQQWGMNLSLSLPLLNFNQGGKAAAHQSLRTVELRKQLAERDLKVQRDSLIQQYRQSVLILEDSEFSQPMEQKHQQMESLFIRGVVPSSLIIEAHRSLVEFEKSRNVRILKALNIFLTLQFMDGQETTESL